MLVYHYHPETGVYENITSDADPDPMEPGKFLIPAHSTYIAPPFVSDFTKQRIVYQGTKWVVEDIPVPPAIYTNLKNYSPDLPMKMWPSVSIKEALKGGVT